MRSSPDPDWEVPGHKTRGAALYKESKRATREREREEKKRRVEEDTEFDEADLRLATVPGELHIFTLNCVTSRQNWKIQFIVKIF